MLDLFSLILTVVDLFGIAGGGGSSSGGGGGGGGFSGGSSHSSSGGSSSGGAIDSAVDVFGFLVFLVLFGGIFIAAAILTVRGFKLNKARRARMNAELVALAAKDKAWEPNEMITRARETFVQYQKDWSSFNLDSMKSYMTPAYYQHNLLMMGALKLAARQNDVQNPVVLNAEVFDYKDETDNSKDAYTIAMNVQVYDVLNDTNDQTKLFSQYLSATEYYKFQRKGAKWLFAGIDQATASPALHNPGLQAFSDKEGFFYSLDWGYLLLPRRGQLFKSGRFGVSDINNHVIGLSKETIVQFYTYVPQPQQPSSSFLIAQAAVPKNYGDIVVRRKKGFWAAVPRGLRKMKTEWGDFNSMYEVLASDSELATSFELLNPTYMEKLQALDFEVNIEVVDNIVYLYAGEMGIVKPEHYQTMLELLNAAFKEMRL